MGVLHEFLEETRQRYVQVSKPNVIVHTMDSVGIPHPSVCLLRMTNSNTIKFPGNVWRSIYLDNRQTQEPKTSGFYRPSRWNNGRVIVKLPRVLGVGELVHGSWYPVSPRMASPWATRDR